ncbi:MAG: translation initiation factor IF-2 subunit beta [Candidatus Thermoplasmatota archaeon]|jgi:translation initiation factor 2 subunit 2|nr:translation initiation factor IF-2 subunit beta [Candidatus Thermoplasmatota archaeon]MCL5799830.1 translation initiation factor IF-2 subunit beta [Candidatus Thermoplasmatota archaeon]
MSDYDYEELLKKAEGTFSKSDRREMRLKIPYPEVLTEGRTTLVRNFGDIIEVINRDGKQISKFLTKEFGIGANIDGKRLIINKKVSQDEVLTKINKYMEIYVKCYECGSPDTEIKREGRVDLLICKACGSQNPIKLSRDIKTSEADVEEGKEYTVTVSEIGQSGEGKASYKGYTVIVPGVRKGETVRVLIKKMRRGVAIAEVIKK